MFPVACLVSAMTLGASSQLLMELAALPWQGSCLNSQAGQGPEQTERRKALWKSLIKDVAQVFTPAHGIFFQMVEKRVL